MGKLNAREAAILRMALDDEARRLDKDAANASGAIGAAFPAMLYRKTDVEDRHVLSIDDKGREREFTVRNLFGGHLCETVIVEDQDQAEALAEDGWDVSPAAAHGVVSGLAVAVSAKDEEIAALRAQLAASQAITADPDPTRRGPGRPPKISE